MHIDYLAAAQGDDAARCGNLESIPELEASDDFTRGPASNSGSCPPRATRQRACTSQQLCRMRAARLPVPCKLEWATRGVLLSYVPRRDAVRPPVPPGTLRAPRRPGTTVPQYHGTTRPIPSRIVHHNDRDDTIGYLSVNGAQASRGNADEQYFNVDTGATTYIVRDRSCITRPDLHRKQKITVKTGSGTSFAESVGPATFYVLGEQDEVIEITRTMVYAPNFGVNLFSPAAAEWDIHGGHVDFDSRFRLTLADGKRIPITRHGRSYRIPYATDPTGQERGLPGPAAAVGALTASSTQGKGLSREAMLWHQRLGHPSYNAIRLLPAHTIGPSFSLSAGESPTWRSTSRRASYAHEHA